MNRWGFFLIIYIYISCFPLFSNNIDSLFIDYDSLSIPDNTDSYSTDEAIDSTLYDNYDSLKSLWYIQTAIQNDTTDSNETVILIPDFSDSVYIERLNCIPSVIPLSYNKIVKNYIDVYTKKQRNIVELMLGLSEYYFPIFDDIIDYYKIPNEIKYLSIIESALNPKAYSRAHAVGLWQFIMSTGKRYGLTINSLVDERRDPIKATNAAARYLLDLHGIFNDWNLAMAAYNCGPGNVKKAIYRSGGKTDYWDIYYYLPRETRGYLPAFIAATYIMNYYKEHNLSPKPIELSLFTDTIIINRNLHFQQISDVIGVPMKALRDLNPQYMADIIPGKSKPYSLKLPDEYIGAFISLQDSIYSYKDSIYLNPTNIASIPSQKSYYHAPPPSDKYKKIYHKVQYGETLGLIAEKYHVKTSDIRYWNNINNNIIIAGKNIVIYVKNNHVPKTSSVNPTKNNVTEINHTEYKEGDFVYYTIRKDDTIWGIANRYPEVSVKEILVLNNIKQTDKIVPGQVIKIKKK